MKLKKKEKMIFTSVKKENRLCDLIEEYENFKLKIGYSSNLSQNVKNSILIQAE